VVFLASPSGAQVQATTPTPEEAAKIAHGRAAEADVPMKSPMLLEIPIQNRVGKNALSIVTPGTIGWNTSEPRKFVCDRARVGRVYLSRGKGKKKIPLEFSASLESEWFRQDVDVTMTLLDPDGNQLAKKFWDDETLGNNAGWAFAGHTKLLKLSVDIPAAQFETLATSEKPLTLKILVEVQGESEHEE
jgi:hypothetical protein